MPVRRKTSTTKLPQSLKEQIGSSDTSHQPQKWHSSNHTASSRKETRKLERATQKQKKAQYFARAPNPRKRAAEEELSQSQSPRSKKPRQVNPEEHTKPTVTKQRPAHTKSTKTLTSEKLSANDPLVKKTALEAREDAYIALLESKLGLKSREKKKSKRLEEDDGLDDLMQWADSFVPSSNYNIEQDQESSSESGSANSPDQETSNDDDLEEWHGIDQDSSVDVVESVHVLQNALEPETGQSDLPPRTTGAYVPPHLRNAQKDEDKTSAVIQRLTKQLKGLLNRMTEQNIAFIIDSFEEVYREHRRNDVTTTLTTLLIDGISSHSSLLDSYVVLHAAFISGLHKVVGIEFAAHLVQSVVSSYERHYEQMRSCSSTSKDNDGKECSNLVVLISELYNFQVISCVLVFDIIRSLLFEELTEFTVELLLKIVRNSGQQLRQDDPSALKDIIEIVQGKISTTDDAVSSRTRFMIETLTNLKNNKLKKNASLNQGAAAVERMKKFLTGLSKTKHILAHEPLRVSLEDLHSAETKGKWWLVGAAWSGNPLVDKQQEFVKSATDKSDSVPVPGESADLIALARSHGMNTDIRRGIFVVLMSSDDYIDACERLAQLNLTEIQQREIIRVILHCCGNERSYNPYYTLVCQQLCRTSHAFKITLQFSLWDFLRELGETTVGGAAVIQDVKDDGVNVENVSETRIKNMARAYAWWIAKDSVTLLILKPVDFTNLKFQARNFLKELFTQLFVSSQRATPLVTSDIDHIVFTRNRNEVEEIFIKASRVQALAMGLVFFLSDAFKNKSTPDHELSKFLRWAISVAKDTLRTGIDVVSTM